MKYEEGFIYLRVECVVDKKEGSGLLEQAPDCALLVHLISIHELAKVRLVSLLLKINAPRLQVMDCWRRRSFGGLISILPTVEIWLCARSLVLRKSCLGYSTGSGCDGRGSRAPLRTAMLRLFLLVPLVRTFECFFEESVGCRT